MHEISCLNFLWLILYHGFAVGRSGCSVSLLSYRVIDDAPEGLEKLTEAEVEDKE